MLNFNFLGFQIDKINYSYSNDETKEDDSDTFTFIMGYDIDHLKEETTKSRLRLRTQVKKPTNNDRILSIDIVISGLFEFSNCNELDEENFDDILKYDGISILFPYARTLIQNISSYDCSNSRIILPPINVKAVVDQVSKTFIVGVLTGIQLKDGNKNQDNGRGE